MTVQAGVWIDHKQAIGVLLTDKTPETKKFSVEAVSTNDSAPKSSAKKKFTPNDFVAEDRLARKVANDRKKFYNDVITWLKGANALLVMGPGEAKGEFGKAIAAKKLRGLVVTSEAADKMTDRQFVAKVKQHFAASPAVKAVAPKKKVKKVAKSAPQKGMKKAKKKGAKRG